MPNIQANTASRYIAAIEIRPVINFKATLSKQWRQQIDKNLSSGHYFFPTNKRGMYITEKNLFNQEYMLFIVFNIFN